MLKTTNYELKKPEQNEYYNVEDFNDNADIIDAELKKLQDNKASLDKDGKIDKTQLPDDIPTDATIGQPGGVASLDEDGKVPADQLPEISSASAVLVTLTTDGWTLSGDRYYQTVSVTGVKADSPVVLVDCALDGTDLDADAAVLEAWQGPSANNMDQGDGTLTFYCYEVPSINIPINVGVIG